MTISRTTLARSSPRLLTWAFIAVIAALVLLPLGWLQWLAIEDGFAGYRAAFTAPGVGGLLLTTLALAVGSVVLAVVLGIAVAWAASTLPPRWRFLRILPILPIIVPTVAGVVGWAFLLSPRPGYINQLLRLLPWWSDLEQGPIDAYTLPVIIFVTALFLTAFVYLFVSPGFDNINSEHIEAAALSGARPITIFFTVTLPLLRPQLVYATSIALLLALGQFTVPLLLGRNSQIDVITTRMFENIAEYPAAYDSAAALGSPLLIVGLAIVLLQKRVLGEQSRFVTVTGRGFRPRRQTSGTAVALILVYTMLAAVLPIAALLLVSVSSFWSGTVDVHAFTLQNYVRVFDDPNLSTAIVNSIVFSVSAAGIVIVLGLVAATLLVSRGRTGSVARSVLDFVVALPLGVPAVVFGAGFLFAYSTPPLVLYGTPWVMILVYVTLMLPFATRMLLAGLLAVGPAVVEASRTSGAGRLRTGVSIILPLLRGSVAGALAIVFILLTHEFSASLLVRSPTTQVMGTVLYDYWAFGSYPIVAALTAVMTVVTGAGVAVALLLGGRGALNRV